MKIILTLLLCLPLAAFSQGDVYLKTTPSKKPAEPAKSAKSDDLSHFVDKFVVEDRVVRYESVYEAPGNSKQDIRDKLIEKLSGDSRVSLDLSNSTGDILTVAIKGFNIDYRKYGYRSYNLYPGFTHPIYAAAAIQIRDGRYRLIMKDIYVLTSDTSRFVLNRDLTFRDNKIRSLYHSGLDRSFHALGKGIDELFDLENSPEADW